METPLFTALMEHALKCPLSLHVPGHKNGMIFFEEARDIYNGILPFDVTELTGLDDLHNAKGAIQKAEQLTALLYGVKYTKFLVNGSTVGNLAMIMASCSQGDVVLVQRNSHKSILNGIRLAGARPVFLAPKIDEDYQVPTYVEVETIKDAINSYPDAKALILTNPNYYGLSVDLTPIVQLAHRYHIPVLADEAHGAHFVLGDPFPKSAIEAGADIIVHSAHKTLPAMTMGSYLHFNSKLVNKEKLDLFLSMLQSSSPSYPIMASLDLARAYLEKKVRENKQKEMIEKIDLLKDFIISTRKFSIIESKDEYIQADPLKLTVEAVNGLSGFHLQHYFESQHIFAELADPSKLLFVLPIENLDTTLDKLSSIDKGKLPAPKKNEMKQYNYLDNRQIKNISSLDYSYSYFDKCEEIIVALHESVGHYSAEAIIPYPPGIPFIMAGEKITVELIEQLKELMEMGVNIQGDENIKCGKIAIYKESR
ncbi:hypothetical protein CHH83_24055 [Bacillus sp. 7586-K]|nr:hypothetical protein CHH83_24055 [Bacillus sp. 7586-K]